MASFYLDEDIPVGLAPLLRSAGHDTRTTLSERRLGAWDADQMLFASGRGWTIVTHNKRDYRALHEAWHVWSPEWATPRPHGGILLLDKGNALIAPDFAAVILQLLQATTPTLPNRTYDWIATGGGRWTEWRA